MSIISVTGGTLVAVGDGPFHLHPYLLVVIGIVAFHAAANVINDFYDTRYEVDQPDSPTARYRPHPILAKLLTPRQLFVVGLALYVVTAAIGCYLAYSRSILILYIGLVGFAASFLYTAGPVKYKYRAMGELSVALMWGPLMFGGAYAAQRQALSLEALYLSIPFGVLVALVLFANNTRDIDYDSRRDVKTLSILLGLQASRRLYILMIVAAYLAMILLVVFEQTPVWSLLVLLSLPKAVSLIRTFSREIPEAADAITAQLDTVFGALLIAGLLVSLFVPL
jgi:1,4-dihydroxy-2-naphthoate octaprenyltransferase